MSAKLRVLLVEGSGRGFLSQYVHALASGLYDAGHEVKLLAGRDDELADWPVAFAKNAVLDRGPKGWWPVLREARAFRPQLVHFQWMHDPFLARPVIACLRRQGSKVVYTPHNLLPHRGRWLSMPIFQRLYRCVDRVVTRDQHMAWAAEELLGVSHDKLSYLPGSPNLLAHPAAPRRRPPEITAKPAGEVRWLCFGHGCARKGLDELLQAFATQEWPRDLHIILAGQGILNGLECDLLRKAGERVRLSVLERYVEPREVVDLFTNSDLLLMPYRKLCKSPIADLAAAFRVPVLRSDRVEASHFCEGVHGLTVPHADPSALLMTLTMLAHSPQRVERMAAALRREESASASIQRLAHHHIRLYRRLLSVPAESTVAYTPATEPPAGELAAIR